MQFTDSVLYTGFQDLMSINYRSAQVEQDHHRFVRWYAKSNASIIGLAQLLGSLALHFQVRVRRVPRVCGYAIHVQIAAFRI